MAVFTLFLVMMLEIVAASPDSRIVTSNLGFRTPYKSVVNEDIKTPEIPKDCEIVQVWMISRHGTRYPSYKDGIVIRDKLPDLARQIQGNFNKSKGSFGLTEDQVWNLQRKLLPEDYNVEEDSQNLHPEGEMELLGIGERYLMRFPDLLSTYNQDKFKFLATGTQRAKQSQFFFATGLFDRRNAYKVRYDESRMPHDPLIRTYKICSKWQREVNLNPYLYRERLKFQDTSLFKETVITTLSRHLGFPKNLTIEDVNAMYLGCSYGQAWTPSKSTPWCSVFSDDMLEMLQYREDLKHYWKDSYPFPITGRLSCFLMKDLMDSFTNRTRNTFYFSHSGMVLKFLTYLGMYREREDLDSDNFIQMRQRRWRTDKIDSFASNLLFALKKCPGNDLSVGLFHNERLVKMPKCENSEWCPWGRFVSKFKESVDGCDLNEICKIDDDKDMTDLSD